MKRNYHGADEGHLNHQEMYEIVADEAHEAVKAQQALQQILASIEETRLPQPIRLQELESTIKAKDEAYQVLEKSYKGIQEDREAMSTLL